MERMAPTASQGSALPHNPGLIYASPSGNKKCPNLSPRRRPPVCAPQAQARIIATDPRLRFGLPVSGRGRRKTVVDATEPASLKRGLMKTSMYQTNPDNQKSREIRHRDCKS